MIDDDRIKDTYIGCHFVVDLDVCGDYAGSEFKESKFLSRLVERGRDAEDEILANDERFWAEHIESGIEPNPSGNSELDLEVQKTYTGPADSSIPRLEIENSFIPLAEQYLHLSSELSKLNAKKKALENDRDEIKLQFGTVLGQGTEGKMDLGDGHYYAVSYKPVSRLKADIDALQAFFPEAFSACVQEEPEAYRLFSIKEKDDRGRLVRNR